MTEPSRDTSKRIFLSYRRSVAQHLSLMLFKELQNRGYDVFRDYNSIGSGNFEKIIKSQIATRDHFILLLTPSTLDRCNYDQEALNPESPNNDDWLRKEIEYALLTRRNIVPLVIDGYEWKQIEPKLTAGLQPLKNLNSANLITTDDRLFDASLDVLCDKYLTANTLKPVTTFIDEKEVTKIINASKSEPVNELALEAEQLLSEGDILNARKLYNDAVNKYSKAIELRPDWGEAYTNRGIAYRHLKDYSRAKEDLDYAISLDPNNAKAHNCRGLVNRRLGNYIEALSDYDKSIQLNPDYVHPYANRGYVNAILGRNNEALNDYSHAISLKPNYSEVYNNRGHRYFYMGQLENAISDLSNAVKLKPNYSRPYKGLGMVYFTLGEYEMANRYFDTALKLAPNLRSAKAGLAVSYHALG
ncbi:MAG: tetratricopeptide repeat protein, partial [Anaerolineae bacterium]|nr:tetratricopeptide repeat protein [Anaerolineae bacterium]